MGSSIRLIRRKLLFLTRERGDFDLVRGKFAACTPPVDLHPTRRITEALTGLRQNHFDAALCAVSREDDVAQVIRIKKAAPLAPLFALVEREDTPLAMLSLQMGARGLIGRGLEPGAASRRLTEAIQARQSGAPTPIPFSGEILAKTSRILASSASNRTPEHPGEGFQPLLLEDDPNDELMFSLSLRRVGLRRRIASVRSVEEAIQYLRGVGAYADRIRHPVPTLVILDFHVGGRTSDEVLRFIRNSPAYQSIPVILLSSTENPADIALMEGLGINLRIVKPHSILDLDRAVEMILDFWKIWNTGGGQ